MSRWKSPYELPRYSLNVTPCECGSRHFDITSEGRVVCVQCETIPDELSTEAISETGVMVEIAVGDKYGSTQIMYRIAFIGEGYKADE